MYNDFQRTLVRDANEKEDCAMFTAEAMLCINQSRSAMLQEASHDSGRGKWISSAKWLHHGSLATGVFTLLWVRHDHDFEISNAAAMAVQRPWSTAPAVKMALHMQKQKGDMCVSNL